MPSIGEMQQRVTVQTKTRGAADGAGGYGAETWATFLTGWAKVDPKSGREIVAADQVVHRISHIVTLRARPGVTTAMRVLFDGRYMAILAAREILEGGRWLELICEETAPS